MATEVVTERFFVFKNLTVYRIGPEWAPDLATIDDLPAGYLSAGQKRRLGLARLLVAEIASRLSASSPK